MYVLEERELVCCREQLEAEDRVSCQHYDAAKVKVRTMFSKHTH